MDINLKELRSFGNLFHRNFKATITYRLLQVQQMHSKNAIKSAMSDIFQILKLNFAQMLRSFENL